eukprot:TRINITY_DN47594_c0_g1_i1.p1 TRINITY_DN47594_c0_g1~~TRINITY_DN47594_c0_g1_i1.p1  ORF type:complete len:541 (+),score=131.47 TRINITY_DN47594_c0_g1_i1:78-1625(+)
MAQQYAPAEEVQRLQWQARNVPSMWALMRRAARAAVAATSASPQPLTEDAVDSFAEDIIRRADRDPAILALIRQAASQQPPQHQQAPAPSQQQSFLQMTQPLGAVPAGTLPAPPVVVGRRLSQASSQGQQQTLRSEDQRLAEWEAGKGGGAQGTLWASAAPPDATMPTVEGPLAAQADASAQAQDPPAQDGSSAAQHREGAEVPSGVLGDTESAFSCDTDEPIPIIPIRCRKPPRKQPAAEGSPAAEAQAAPAGDAAQQAGPQAGQMQQAQQAQQQAQQAAPPAGASAEAAANGDFHGRIRSVLESYRAGVAERCRVAMGSGGRPSADEIAPLPPPPPASGPTSGIKLALLKAAFDAGALSQQAYAGAVCELRQRTPAPEAEPPPPRPQPSGSPSPLRAPPAPRALPSLQMTRLALQGGGDRGHSPFRAVSSVSSLISSRAGIISPSRPRPLPALAELSSGGWASPRPGDASLRSHSARVMAAQRAQRHNCRTPRPEEVAAARLWRPSAGQERLK